MSPPQILLDVRYEADASRAIDDACEKWARTDDQVRLLEWIIIRDPREGKALTESGMTRTLTLPGAVSINAPTVTFVYVIEELCIAVQSARFEDAKPETRTLH